MERAGPDGPLVQARPGRRKLEREGQAHGTCALKDNRGPQGPTITTGGVAGDTPARMGCAGDFGSGQGKGLSPQWNKPRTYDKLKIGLQNPPRQAFRGRMTA